MEPKSTDEELLTVPEAARRVNLTEDAIRKAIRSTKLRAMQKYGRLLIRPDDLAAWNSVRKTGRPPAVREMAKPAGEE